MEGHLLALKNYLRHLIRLFLLQIHSRPVLFWVTFSKRKI